MKPPNDPLLVPDYLRRDVMAIFDFTDAFCARHLDAEYGEIVRKLVTKLARKRPSPHVTRRPSDLGGGGDLHCR